MPKYDICPKCGGRKRDVSKQCYDCYIQEKTDLESRFWHSVKKAGAKDCWEWIGAISGSGYGHVQHKGRSLLAHRVAWQLTNGSIPEGLLICHVCDNRICVNPEHLFIGTYASNYHDSAAKGRNTRGTKNAMTALTENEVLELRAQYSTQNFTLAKLASMYNMSQSGIFHIVKRETWAWLK